MQQSTEPTAKVASIPWKRDIVSGFETFSILELQKRRLRFPVTSTLTKPERIEFHSLLLFTEGTGEQMVDFERHTCKRNTLLHISPNQINSYHHPSSVDGHVLIMRSDFLPAAFFEVDSVSVPPCEYLWPTSTNLSTSQAEFLVRMFDLLSGQQTKPGEWQQLSTARHLALAVASFSYRTAIQQANIDDVLLSNPLFFDFLSLLNSEYATHRDARWYATQLDCSYRTLCRVCKRVVSKTPKMLHDERVVTEARRLLAYTLEPVYVIAKRTGFTESTNFVKFFQRVSNETPDHFRRRWRDT